MPFINTRINRPLSPEKEELLKTRLGEAISTFPGKSEQWLMLGFEDNARLWFRGEKDFPMAFVEVELLGEAADAVCEKMTARICEILSDVLGISPDAVYVKYVFIKSWGWNGQNF
jgi:phenylpyruvate tautomerase PptA (4-oxalocrotonate tautomerase family)